MNPAGHLPFDPVAEARARWERNGWPEAAAGMAAITSLMRAQAIVLARVEALLRPRGLTFARYEVLMLLVFSRRGSLPLSVIGSRLQVHPASVTNAVGRLQAGGLVLRRPHPQDGRAAVAEITDAGRAQALAATDALNAEVFARPGLDPERVEQLVDLLRELRRQAGDF